MFTIARRSLAQLGVGILVGAPIARVAVALGSDTVQNATPSPFLLTFAVSGIVMVLIGVLACTARTLRALRIMPAEALRE